MRDYKSPRVSVMISASLVINTQTGSFWPVMLLP